MSDDFPIGNVDKGDMNIYAMEKVAEFLETDQEFEIDFSLMSRSLFAITEKLFGDFIYDTNQMNVKTNSISIANLIVRKQNEFFGIEKHQDQIIYDAPCSFLLYPPKARHLSEKYKTSEGLSVFFLMDDKSGIAKVFRQALKTGIVDWRVALPKEKRRLT